MQATTSESRDDDVLYLKEIKQVFMEELHFSESHWDRYYKKILEPRLKYLSPTRSKKMAFMLRHEVMAVINEVKEKGYFEMFSD